MKKKILIIAPTGRLGGRELETGFIASVLSKFYDVRVISTANYYCDSEVISFDNIDYTSLNRILFKKSFLIRALTFITSIFRKDTRYSHRSLSISSLKRMLNIETRKKRILSNEIKKNDLTFICAQVYSNYIKFIVETSKDHKIPVIFRTTGTINENIGKLNFTWINNVSLFIHHSKSNANRLDNFFKNKFILIDQCAFNEDKLLNIEISNQPISNFFTLSRLSKEKQLDVVINAFNTLNNKSDILYIFGEGPELENLRSLAKNNPNIVFNGQLVNNKTHHAFRDNDCLIISSSEEAGPLTGIEAMAAGKILISTRVGAMSERISNYKHWYDGTKEELIKEIQNIKTLQINDIINERQQLREIYKENHTIEVVSGKYLNGVSMFFNDNL